MKFCRRCLVYLENSNDSCPLCGKIVLLIEQISNNRKNDLIFTSKRHPDAFAMDNFWKNRRQQSPNFLSFVKGVFTIVSIATVIVLLVMELALFKNSGIFIFHTYVAVISILYFVFILTYSKFFKRAFLVPPIMGLLTLIYLCLLDIKDFELSWFFIAWPIVGAVFTPISLPSISWHFSKIKSYNIISSLFFGLAISIILLDVAISRAFAMNFYIHSWSIIVAGVLISLATVCLLLHFMLKITVRLDMVFHTNQDNHSNKDI